MKFVIDRKIWRRGGDMFRKTLAVYGSTRLLNEKGYMCCLGQIALQCGVPKREILLKGEPERVDYGYTRYHELLTINEKNNQLASAAMSINDGVLLSDAEREQKLIELFAAHGHELEFVQ